MAWQECQALTAVDESDARAEAAQAAAAVLNAFREGGAWSELGPRGQVALLDLEVAMTQGVSTSELHAAILEAHRRVGPPGDWGYGHPEGKALAWLYETTRLLAPHVAGGGG